MTFSYGECSGRDSNPHASRHRILSQAPDAGNGLPSDGFGYASGRGVPGWPSIEPATGGDAVQRNVPHPESATADPDRAGDGRAVEIQADLFGSPVLPAAAAGDVLDGRHYLGAAKRGFTYATDDGLLVLANPTSRRLPHVGWLELTRWCITGGKNAGSRQWAAVAAFLRAERPDVTTVVSYSDPSVGHTGALYRACNWLWAPTWHRLRPPPSGNGNWGTGAQSVKDRWVFPLRPDPVRAALLAFPYPQDSARFAWAEYREPQWRGLHRRGGGGDYARLREHLAGRAAA